jgi:hydroxymethylpyrimidine/phosphomethylpyrimidine kinase
LLGLGAAAVLIKGGHGTENILTDYLIIPDGVVRFSRPRIATKNTHGTGCTLASAIASGLAQGLGVQQAVARAVDYLHQAILAAPGFGRGFGPVNHGFAYNPSDDVRNAPRGA